MEAPAAGESGREQEDQHGQQQLKREDEQAADQQPGARQRERQEAGGSPPGQAAAAAGADTAAAAPLGLAPPAGLAAGEGQQGGVAMDLRGSADLEAEVAAMLSGMNQGATEGPAPTDSAAPSGSGMVSGEEQPSAGPEGVPVLPDWVRNRDSRKDLPMICHIVDCGQDLSTHPEYYQRYRICKAHLKSPALLVDGIVQRFCQQCGRFHLLKEFDGDKRNCRARLQQHNSRRRKVSAMGQELRHGRYNSQPDASTGMQGLPGEGQPWQWGSWQGAPAGTSLLPLSLSNGSLSGLEALGASGGASSGLPPLPGLSLPLPPLPQPGVAPLPALASAVSGSGPAYASAFPAAAGSLAGQAMAQAPLTGSKRDYAAMLHGGSTLSPSLAAGSAQQAPPPIAPAMGPPPPIPSTPCLLLDRMAQDALAAAAQQGQAAPAPHWPAASAAPAALQQHPGAQPLVSLFPQLADSVQRLSQQVQQVREQYGSQLGAPQLSVISSAAKQQQQPQHASGVGSTVTSALLKALLSEAAPQQAQQAPAQLPQQDANGAAAAANLAKSILANLQQQRQLSPAPTPQQPGAQQQHAQPQPQPAAAVSAVPSPQPAGTSAAPDAATLLRALLQKHGLQAAGASAHPPAAPAPAVASAQEGGGNADAIKRLAAALLQPAAPAAAAVVAAQQPASAVGGSPGS